jgi:hypothetical protein
MSLDEWGTIAEIVGALAVVITLVYLAIQVKHSKESLDANTKAIRGQSISDVTRNVHDQMQMLAQGHDMTEWFGKFVTGETLDSKDALLTDAFLSAIFMARQNEFLQWQQGLLDETVFKSLHHVTRLILLSPNGEHWWNHEGRSMYAPEFVEFVDKLCGEMSSDELEKFKHAIRLEEVEKEHL